MRPDLAISIFAGKMLANRPITVFGDGNQTRDFTYIDDVVRVNRRLLETSAADGHVMNVGGGHRITVNDLIAHLREITGSASEVVYSKKQKGDAEHTLADTALARELVGYRPGGSLSGRVCASMLSGLCRILEGNCAYLFNPLKMSQPKTPMKKMLCCRVSWVRQIVDIQSRAD
ncbi:MAG: NAD-dependent epimerase/dehydratase family protein [Candidatus Methanoculleus thermohydrogenotrophicum]|nr:NAD-dependent epimerase/dehydratase family protein [Candidatus Methanoculleus thermohydrogenotrophicum]